MNPSQLDEKLEKLKSRMIQGETISAKEFDKLAAQVYLHESNTTTEVIVKKTHKVSGW